MSEPASLNESEQFAYGQMAQALAWHAYYRAEHNGDHFPGVSEPVYYHYSDSQHSKELPIAFGNSR